MPAARAITFFRALPSSIPRISGLVYTRNTWLMKIPCTNSATCFLCAPATQVVGSPLLTSSAWLGPDRTVTSASGSSCSIICDRVIRVCSSIPLATLVMTWPGLIYAFILRAVSLTNTEGTARTSRSLSSMASFRSSVKPIATGIFTSGRFLWAWVSFSSFISSGIADQITT